MKNKAFARRAVVRRNKVGKPNLSQLKKRKSALRVVADIELEHKVGTNVVKKKS